jgi:steroid delta-isomerase
MRLAVERYASRLSAGDGDGVADLFADQAWIEDPIGSERKVGREVLRVFYAGAIERAHPQVELTGPVRTTNASAAAAPLRSRSFFGGRNMVIDIIDVFTFDSDGLIESMCAYFGPSNMADAES